MSIHPQLSVVVTNWTSEFAEDPRDWRFVKERAVAAERAGFDRVSVNDHVVYGEHMDEYQKPELGGMKGGQQPTGADGAWLEPLTCLAVIAGATSRVRLATGILLAALRRPVVLAKSLATLDGLSGARLDIGVGVGWQREEYEAAGLDFGKRGKLLDHTLEVCQRLWRETPVDFDDEFLHFDRIHMMPKPEAAGGVPIWVSGSLNDRVVKRIARYGSGWLPWGAAEFGNVAQWIPVMRQKVEALGRDPKDIGVVGSIQAVLDANGKPDAAATMAVVPGLVEAGVTDVRLWMPMSKPDAELDDNFGQMVAAFRRHVAVESAGATTS